MQSLEIRKKFFSFFEKNNHTKVPSSSLIPAQDPTLLFANAGMNQFKDLFLGLEERPYKRAVSIQKCIRAGGKHNDLDNVGFTKRHLTFFEMMGNFSFGDYFKRDAIHFAWTFLTQEIGLPADKLHASVFLTDDESYNIWHKDIGLPAHRIHRLGAEDNFWQMGDTGPCGPCTEIYIDRGSTYGSDLFGRPESNERFLEIWNLVFMQYNRQGDGSNMPLERVGVDTGMGLERLCAVMQEKDSVFQTDLFAPLIAHIEEETALLYTKQIPAMQAAFHVLADHIRSASLIIADGAAPSNEGRGYVLRKIIRRAALFAQKLSKKSIFPDLCTTLIQEMSSIYPELTQQQPLIHSILSAEIDKFSLNLLRGQELLRTYFLAHENKKIIAGIDAFKLYDTYGFPLELIHLMAHEHGFTVDTDGFHKEMNKQKEQSGKKPKTSDPLADVVSTDISTKFTGYQELETTSSIIALITDNKAVSHVVAGNLCWVMTAQSPFFIVGGGQVPDQGHLSIDGHIVPIQEVRYIGNAIGSLITAPVAIYIGTSVTSIVDREKRTDAMKNHTATHLLQAALMQLLGKQIKQSGSLVHPDYLRFDFTYHEHIKQEDIEKIENIVNEKIRDNIKVISEYMPLKEATERGAIAFFGDKYNPEKVRVIQIGAFSAELCGGTHVSATGEIGTFKITEATALAAGHRRIVAVTGKKAIDLFQHDFNTIKKASNLFKVQHNHVWDSIAKQQQQLKDSASAIQQLKQNLIKSYLPTWQKQLTTIGKNSWFFIEAPAMLEDSLQEIAQTVASHITCFCFSYTKTDTENFSFCLEISPLLANTIDMKKLAELFRNSLGFSCGGSHVAIRGKGKHFDQEEIATIIKTNKLKY